MTTQLTDKMKIELANQVIEMSDYVEMELAPLYLELVDKINQFECKDEQIRDMMKAQIAYYISSM